MSSIQINTESLKMHQFDNIKLSFFLGHKNQSLKDAA